MRKIASFVAVLIATTAFPSGGNAAPPKNVKSEYTVGSARFKILKVWLGDGFRIDGMILALTGKTSEQTCLMLNLEVSAGDATSALSSVSDKEGEKFDNKSCMESPKGKKKLLQCAFAVDKASRSFALNLSDDTVVSLSSFMR